jgi:ubiquinone/menaquinone biosynthesis C-methylase UbiE
LLWISKMAKNLTFYGIDIQKQMIGHCMKNLKKWNLEAGIYRADAEELPFRDEKFDVVFHLGAINLFFNKQKAINEMIRVAKPGTKIIIADETEKAGRLFNYFTGSKDKIVPPFDLIPSGMLDKKIEIIWKGYGYVISFLKPKSN